MDKNHPILTVQVARGAPGRWAWRMNARGTQLPGIGGGAFANGDRAAVRVGEVTVLLTLLREARPASAAARAADQGRDAPDYRRAARRVLVGG